jgi:hypothetical protein
MGESTGDGCAASCVTSVVFPVVPLMAAATNIGVKEQIILKLSTTRLTRFCGLNISKSARHLAGFQGFPFKNWRTCKMALI